MDVAKSEASRPEDLPESYDVALSFASEDRAYVEQVATGLSEKGVSVFYDRFDEVELWGKDLATHLIEVYRGARYCVLFLSEHYAARAWTNLERSAALSR